MSTTDSISKSPEECLSQKIAPQHEYVNSRFSYTIRKIIIFIAWFLYIISSLLSIGFAVYIILKFLIKPVNSWITINWFGETSHGAIFMAIHWIGGILVSLCGIIQLIPYFRKTQKRLRIHRWNGRIYILGAILASIGGLLYTFTRGTYGGISMDITFAIYGVLFLISSVLTIYYARKGLINRHKRWAVRTFALGIGSLLYRLYVLPLFATAFGTHKTPDQEARDREMLYLNIAAWLFYIPNLLVAEIVIYLSWGYGNRSDHLKSQA